MNNNSFIFLSCLGILVLVLILSGYRLYRRKEIIDKQKRLNRFFLSESFNLMVTRTQLIYLILMIAFLLMAVWLLTDRIILLLRIVSLVVLIVAIMLFKKKLSKIRVLADVNGLQIESWIGCKYYPWKGIKSVFIQDREKGPIRIVTSHEDLALWNSVHSADNMRLLELIEEHAGIEDKQRERTLTGC